MAAAEEAQPAAPSAAVEVAESTGPSPAPVPVSVGEGPVLLPVVASLVDAVTDEELVVRSKQTQQLERLRFAWEML